VLCWEAYLVVRTSLTRFLERNRRKTHWIMVAACFCSIRMMMRCFRRPKAARNTAWILCAQGVRGHAKVKKGQADPPTLKLIDMLVKGRCSVFMIHPLS
jgi:hypothetical protein